MARIYGNYIPTDTKGAQRLSVERLQRWQALEYGMFIHFGIATYNLDLAHLKPEDYRPPRPVDTDQWARVARDAGMRYILFTTQHTNSFTMWDTRMEGLPCAARSARPQDVVRSFVDSCRTHDIVPCFYYSQSRFAPWRNEFRHHADALQSHVTRAGLDAVKRQLDELLTNYGPIGELWIDGPVSYGQAGRCELYEHATGLQPDMVFVYNGWGEDRWRLPRFHCPTGWPSDVQCLEVLLPPFGEPSPWRSVSVDRYGRKLATPVDMYIPVESCMVMHRNQLDWYHDPDAEQVSDDELLGMRLVAKARQANLVLNVTPDASTRIPEEQVAALMRLREGYTRRKPEPCAR